jgi:hypothetical protein
MRTDNYQIGLPLFRAVQQLKGRRTILRLVGDPPLRKDLLHAFASAFRCFLSVAHHFGSVLAGFLETGQSLAGKTVVVISAGGSHTSPTDITSASTPSAGKPARFSRRWPDRRGPIRRTL